MLTAGSNYGFPLSQIPSAIPSSHRGISVWGLQAGPEGCVLGQRARFVWVSDSVISGVLLGAGHRVPCLHELEGASTHAPAELPAGPEGTPPYKAPQTRPQTLPPRGQ